MKKILLIIPIILFATGCDIVASIPTDSQPTAYKICHDAGGLAGEECHLTNKYSLTENNTCISFVGTDISAADGTTTYCGSYEIDNVY